MKQGIERKNFSSPIAAKGLKTVMNSTGRYDIGEEIIVGVYEIAIPGKPGFGPRKITNMAPLRPWDIVEGVKISKIILKKLTVTEHHKVPGFFGLSDEAPYDGYILVDEDGAKYTNQYPHAQYGQLDDSADRMFRREGDPKNFPVGEPNTWMSVASMADRVVVRSSIIESLAGKENTDQERLEVNQDLQNGLYQSQIAFGMIREAFARQYGDKFSLVDKIIYPAGENGGRDIKAMCVLKK